MKTCDYLDCPARASRKVYICNQDFYFCRHHEGIVVTAYDEWIDSQIDYIEFPPDCSDLTCKRCYPCYSEYVAAKMAGELD